MNEITHIKVAELACAIVAGMQSNPANGNTEMNIYNLQSVIYQTTQAVTQGLQQAGYQIVQADNHGG